MPLTNILDRRSLRNDEVLFLDKLTTISLRDLGMTESGIERIRNIAATIKRSSDNRATRILPELEHILPSQIRVMFRRGVSPAYLTVAIRNPSPEESIRVNEQVPIPVAENPFATVAIDTNNPISSSNQGRVDEWANMWSAVASNPPRVVIDELRPVSVDIIDNGFPPIRLHLTLNNRPLLQDEIRFLDCLKTTKLLELGLDPRYIDWFRRVARTLPEDIVPRVIPELGNLSRDNIRASLLRSGLSSIDLSYHIPLGDTYRVSARTFSFRGATTRNNIEQNNEDPLNPYESLSDIQRKYQECLFLFEGTVFKASEFREEDGGDVTIRSRMAGSSASTYIPYTKELFILPKNGYINVPKGKGGYAIFMERNYRRDDGRYKRGLYPRNYTLYSISDRELKNTVSQYRYDPIMNGNYSILLELVLYNRSYPDYKSALNDLLSFDVLSVALSSTVCISLNSHYNKFVILKNTWIIGSYNAKKDVWVLSDNLFTEDLDKLNIPYLVTEEAA
jgi:hypothetical protein